MDLPAGGIRAVQQAIRSMRANCYAHKEVCKVFAQPDDEWNTLDAGPCTEFMAFAGFGLIGCGV